MADLRKLIEAEGGSNVRTLLNSGNAVFSARAGKASALSRRIEAAIEKSVGFTAATIVITAQEVDSIIEANPLAKIATEPPRHLVTFLAQAEQREKARPLLSESWKPEHLAIGENAIYLWCANGILESRLLQSFGRVMGTHGTSRNWATVAKIQALAKEVAAQSKG